MPNVLEQQDQCLLPDKIWTTSTFIALYTNINRKLQNITMPYTFYCGEKWRRKNVENGKMNKYATSVICGG